jgi:hypothetical protein
MARLNREIAEGSKRLVAANAEANDKLLTAQQQLDNQRTQIDAQCQVLADERHRESILGPLITGLGMRDVRFPQHGMLVVGRLSTCAPTNDDSGILRESIASIASMPLCPVARRGGRARHF